MLDLDPEVFAGLQPARPLPTDDDAEPLEELGLCLSGGGYRAMLFHVGALLRLNEAGRLRELDRVSSVSGGSITAATLGLHWGGLDWDDEVARNLEALLVDPIRELARHTIDFSSVLEGALAVHVDRRASRRCLSRPPLRPGHPPGPSREAAVHHQRHQPRDRRPVSLLAPVCRRLARRADRRPGDRARHGGRRLLGLPACAVALRA